SVVILHAGSLVQWAIAWPDVFFQPVDGYPCRCLRAGVRHNLDVLFSPADTDVCSSGAGRPDGRRLVHLHQPPKTVRAAAALIACLVSDRNRWELAVIGFGNAAVLSVDLLNP